jgi:hypothetical protein
MKRSLREHVSFLEKRVQDLYMLIMSDGRTQAERNCLESKIRAAEASLAFFRRLWNAKMN